MRLLILGGLLLSACAPRLTPPYRDYRIEAADDLNRRLRDAVEDAGWTVVASDVPGVVATAPRRIDGGLTPATAAVELVPLGAEHVRVWVHVEQRGLFGGRSKAYTLSPALRARTLGALTEALEARGLVPLDAPRERDEAATRR